MDGSGALQPVNAQKTRRRHVRHVGVLMCNDEIGGQLAIGDVRAKQRRSLSL